MPNGTDPRSFSFLDRCGNSKSRLSPLKRVVLGSRLVGAGVRSIDSVWRVQMPAFHRGEGFAGRVEEPAAHRGLTPAGRVATPAAHR